MTVLHRDALEASPLADLHAIAVGARHRRLPPPAQGRAHRPHPARRRWRRRRPRRQRRRRRNGDTATPRPRASPSEVVDEAAEDEDARPRRRRGSRGGRGRSGRDEADRDDGDDAEDGAERRDETIEGVVELLGNGSGFVRVSPPEPSDDDVYISAAQVRRCELVSGDRVSGPVRKPRRSERYPSLVRVDTINGAPAEEVAEGTPYDELPCAFPTVRLELGSDDPTLKAIEWLTPIGRGSRVAITGGALAGKTETLRRLAAALAGRRGPRAQPRAHRRAPGGGRRVEVAARWRPRPPLDARRRGRRPGARRSSARSRPPSASPPAAATRSSSSTPSTASPRASRAGRWRRRAPSSTAAR